MLKKIIDHFQKYNELQNLLLSMTNDEKINEVKNFIDNNNLFKNKNKTLSTIRLIGSAVLVNHNLLSNSVKLLNLYQSIDMYNYRVFLDCSKIADKEISSRLLIILLLFDLSKHEILLDKRDFDYCEIAFLSPTEFITKNRMMLHDFKNILQLSDEEKIAKRNLFLPIHPIITMIREDDLNSLLPYISNNNYDIDQKIGKSLFNRHAILQNSTLLEISAFFGSINSFKFLLNKSNNIDYKRLLSMSFAGGNYEIIHIIENECHDETIKENIDCLYNSILYFHNDLIEYIIQNYHVQIDAESYIKCIYSSNYGAMMKLHKMDHSDAINNFGKIGSTPLDVASFEGYLDFMKYLLSIDAIDVKKLNSFGKTILQSAARSNKTYIIEYILKHNLVDPNNKGKFRLSAVRIARNYYCEEAFSLLKPVSTDNLEEEEDNPDDILEDDDLEDEEDDFEEDD